MPDVDKFRKLSRRWAKMYQKVCEGYFPNDSLADDAVGLLRKDILGYGNSIIRFLKEVSNRLNDIRDKPLFLPAHNWSGEDEFIQKLKLAHAQNHPTNQSGLYLAIKACKDLIHKLRNGDVVNGNLEEVLVRTYIHNIYDSRFVDPVLLEIENQVDAKEDIILRLSEMRPFIDDGIDLIASGIVRRRKDIKRLRSKARSSLRAVSINDDVFSIGTQR